MATRRIRATPTDELEDVGEDTPREWGVPVGAAHLPMVPDEDPEPPAPAERLAAMLEEAATAERAVVRVYRVGEPGKPLDWCANYSVSDFEAGGDLALIRATYGPGRYSIRIFGALKDGTRRTGLLSRVDVGIVADPTVKPAGVMQGAPVGTGTDLAQLAAILQDGQRQVLEAVTRVTQQPVRDPMEEMTKMLSLMTMMRTAMGLDQKPAQTPISELLAAIRELKAASAEFGTKEPDPEPSLMSLGAQLLTMVKDRVPPTVAPVQVPPSLQGSMPFPPIMPAHGVAPPADVRDNPKPGPMDIADAREEQQDMATNQAAEVARVRGLFEGALALAQGPAQLPDGRSSIEAGAELLYGTEDSDGLPDELLGAMSLPNWWELLTSIPELAQGLKPFEPWVRQVRELMLEWHREDSEDVSGDDGLPADNGVNANTGN